jgi:SMI1 / KNR4 family (SUKH-1)
MAFPTTEDRIAAAEAQLGSRLPVEYRNRLISNNGGELETSEDVWQVFPVFDDSDRKRAGRSANHIVRETQQATQWPGFPSGAVAVAANGTGDLLVFLPGPDGVLSGRLQHWMHESRECIPTPLDFT